MIIFCVLGITTDFIIESYSIMNFKYVYIYIIYIINEVLIYCYSKYMMDKLYYHYSEIVLYWGILGLIAKFIIFSSLAVHEYVNNIDNSILHGLYTYFKETSVVIIIFYQFFYYIIYNFLYYVLIIVMIYYLRPNHMIISDEIQEIQELIFYEDWPNKYYALIPLSLQMLALLFYFEILEFNFCGLNKNTAKNIKKREGNENKLNIHFLEKMNNDDD